MPAQVGGRGFQLRRIRQFNRRAQFSPSQAAQHQVGSRALRFTTPEKSCRLGHFLDRVYSVGGLRRAVDRDQHAGTNWTRSCRPSRAFGPGRRLSRRNLLHRIGLLLALLLQQNMDEMAFGLQGLLQWPVGWPVTAKLFVTDLLELCQKLYASVQVLLRLRVELLGCLLEGFVERLGRELALLDLRCAALFGVVCLCQVLIAEFPRLIVIDQVVALLDDRRQFQGDFEFCSDKTQRGGTGLRISIFQFGVESVPELLQQPETQSQTVPQTGKAALLERCFRVPGSQLKIFALVGQQVGGELDHLVVVGDLSVLLGHARRRLRFLAPGLLDLVVDGVIAQTGARGILAWYRLQQIVGKGHDQAATEAELNSSARNSRKGTSSSSTCHIFCPNGTWNSAPSVFSQTVILPRRTASSG